MSVSMFPVGLLLIFELQSNLFCFLPRPHFIDMYQCMMTPKTTLMKSKKFCIAFPCEKFKNA